MYITALLKFVEVRLLSSCPSTVEVKGATSRYFAPVFAPNKTIVKLKETKKYTHGKIEKY